MNAVHLYVPTGMGRGLQGCRDWATRMSPDAERPEAKVRHQLEAQKPMKTVGEGDEVTCAARLGGGPMG